MPTLTVETAAGEYATFVEAVVTADEPHEIRLEAQFGGTIWPPRTNGTVIEGWDTKGLTTEIDAGRTAIGFATPAHPESVAIEIVHSTPRPTGLPDGISAWIERVETRLETAKPFARADDLPAATEAIASVGGLSAAETLASEVERDRRLANQLSVVPDNLRQRLNDVEIPTTTYASIASRTTRR